MIAGLAEDGARDGSAPAQPSGSRRCGGRRARHGAGCGQGTGRSLEPAARIAFRRLLNGIRAEATRERVIDRLHAELQEYKQDFLLKVQRPIFIDLIQLHDDIGKMIDARRQSARRRIGDRWTCVGFSNRFRPPSKTSCTVRGSNLSRWTGRSSIHESNARSRHRRQTTRNSTSALLRLRKGFYSGEKLIRPGDCHGLHVSSGPGGRK